jgi:MFS family permease
MLTMPFTSRLLGRYNSRTIMLAGALIFNVMLSLPGFAVTTMQLVIVLFCFGSSRNLLNLSMNTQAVGVQEFYDKSIITTFHGVWSLAGFAGAGLGYLMLYFEVGTYQHLLSVSIFLVGLSLYFFRDTLYQKPVYTTKGFTFSLPDKTMIKFAVICFATMACENIMYDWSGIYFVKVVQSSRAVSIGAFATYMVMMAIGRFTGDKLVNRLGVKRIIQYSGILIFSGLMLAVILPYTISAGLGFAMVGLGVSCVVPLVFKIAGKSLKVNTGQALASISTIGYFGFLLVPPIVGFIAELTNLRFSFGLIALLTTIIYFAASKIQETSEESAV